MTGGLLGTEWPPAPPESNNTETAEPPLIPNTEEGVEPANTPVESEAVKSNGI